MVPFYFLSVKSRDLKLVVSVNGAPLVLDRDGEGITVIEPVNHWLRASGNQFQLDIFGKNEPTTSLPQAMEVKVFEADPDNDIPTPLNVLAEYEWPDPNVVESYPYQNQIDLSVSKPPNSRVWQEAVSISSVERADKQEMLSVVEGFRDALAARQEQNAFDYLSYRYAEEALAEGKPVQQLRPVVLEQYQWLFQQNPTFTIPPLRDAKYNILPCKRLVRFSNGDWGHGLSFSGNDGLEGGIEIYFAKIQKQWAIVR